MAPERDTTAPAPTRADRAFVVAGSLREWLTRPRVRLAVVGAILLLAGGLALTNSVWTLPLVLVGSLMIATAWIGHRLEGRFAIEWGAAGTQVDFRARLATPVDAPLELPRATAEVDPAAGAEIPDADVIEGEAHTVEIDVAQLKTLIAAVETTSNGAEPPEATADAIRILRVAADRDP